MYENYELKCRYMSVMTDIKIAEYYFLFYAVRSKHIRTAILILCALSTSVCLYNLLQYQRFTVILAAVIFIAQIIALIQPFLPYDKRLVAASYIHRDIAQLTLQMELTLMDCTYGKSPENLLDILKGFMTSNESIQAHYASADMFPYNRRLFQMAEKNAGQYMKINFGECDNIYEQDPAASDAETIGNTE